MSYHPNRSKKSAAKKAKPAVAKPVEIAVVVTTEHRGVFFGYTTDTSGATIKLRAARNCIHWSAAVRGFMGLAATGPDARSKVGPAADIELRAITSVMLCTPAATAAWEAAPWTS